ncbi:hypothetical protein [Rothia endophytica]|uniref:hypothetical protein n=1 Tax=Rothia endophytica TaxID=1324766 RepID=UPI001F3ABAA2|nr:hypothetical protein [Rothia endophytica]
MDTTRLAGDVVGRDTFPVGGCDETVARAVRGVSVVRAVALGERCAAGWVAVAAVILWVGAVVALADAESDCRTVPAARF